MSKVRSHNLGYRQYVDATVLLPERLPLKDVARVLCRDSRPVLGPVCPAWVSLLGLCFVFPTGWFTEVCTRDWWALSRVLLIHQPSSFQPKNNNKNPILKCCINLLCLLCAPTMTVPSKPHGRTSSAMGSNTKRDALLPLQTLKTFIWSVSRHLRNNNNCLLILIKTGKFKSDLFPIIKISPGSP